MKYIHRLLLVPTILAVSGLLTPSASYAVVKPTEEDGPVLPEIWQKAGPRERLKATRAAELDADRLLAERIYGLQVDSETTVQDLAAGDDAIAGAVSATLVGSITTEQPEYLPDGRVQVVRAVKIREVIDTLNRVIKGKRLEDGSIVTTADNTKTNREVKDKVIDVMGNAALPGSEGHQKIMAKRAAEMDAYRRLAGRMMGVKIDGNTTVRDFALEHDEILASLSQVLKAASPTGIKYNKSDGSCEVTMEIKTQDIIRTTRRFLKGTTTKTEIKDEVQEKTFSETGMGAMRDVAKSDAPSGGSTAGGKSEPFFETEIILKEVVQSGPVVQ
ncbi:MAG: hypothetical protein EBS96_14490 [Spartobacteria bacterium]|nr:hypothetical protein [Spartobacteria bacterium]